MSRIATMALAAAALALGAARPAAAQISLGPVNGIFTAHVGSAIGRDGTGSTLSAGGSVAVIEQSGWGAEFDAGFASDDRGHSGTGPPIVLFRYAPGRGGVHAERFLQGFRGRFLQCDGYEGYDLLTRTQRPEGLWTLVHCWSHLRRRFVKLVRTTRSPIAETALRQIGALYAVEATYVVRLRTSGSPPDASTPPRSLRP